MNTESKRKVSKHEKPKFSRENRIASSPRGSMSYSTIFANKKSEKEATQTTQKEIIAQFFDSMVETIACCRFTGAEIDDDESNKSEAHSNTSNAHSATTSSTDIKTVVTESQNASSSSQTSVKGTIHFVNDNIYEGDLFKGRMHGDGRFQWLDGTIYRGQFRDNRITGIGIIEFKDNSWYEGEFFNNVRHGRGLFVDSAKRRSYFGHWSGGAKHGQGVMYYMNTFQNSYDGEWCNNFRQELGLRRYCPHSGYDGDWNNNIREGSGLMIWPNCDMYDGEWKNNLMCGDGKYIWGSYNNDSMSLPALCVYRGGWEGGLRNGRGVIDFGFGMGSCYRGQFKNNRKNGVGQLVTNNGRILHDIQFVDDNINTQKDYDGTNETTHALENNIAIDMCNELELGFHVREAFQPCTELSDNKILKGYLEANYNMTKDNIKDIINNDIVTDFNDLLEFEINSLRKSLMYYQLQLKRIYKDYATVCNEKPINFEPVLIKMYLWQMYYDCKIHYKGLTLYKIDKLLSRNTKWQVRNPHDPFEEIYFWQFLHSLISVATHIYAQNFITNRKPDTVLASAFRKFIDEDILPRFGKKRGKLANGYGRVVPLENLYKIYLELGSPCTVRSIICGIHQGGSRTDTSSNVVRKVFRGKNVFFYDDEVSFLFDNIEPYVIDLDNCPKTLDLSCFNNVPPKTIIEIFSAIFPRTTEAKKVIILDTKLTFFEFFEAFITLAEESVKLDEIANFTLVQ